MSELLPYILPALPPRVMEQFAAHQTTHAFYHEVRLRQEFEQYCQWYEQVAAQHRQEFTQMQSEANLLGWFYRRG